MTGAVLKVQLLAVFFALAGAAGAAFRVSAVPEPWASRCALAVAAAVAWALSRLHDWRPRSCPRCGDDLDGVYGHLPNDDGTCRVVFR